MGSRSPGLVMGLLRRRWVQVTLVAGLLLFMLGVYLLLHPGGLWLQPWRAETKQLSNRFVLGPYPLEDDFIDLKKRGVTTIISLLDPKLPYEHVLLGQERELAKKYDMKVLNFPMASILGQGFGENYVKHSRLAAQAAIDSEGVAYIHCYLGVHRAAYVQKLLEAHGNTVVARGTMHSDDPQDAIALVEAKVAFSEADYEGALRRVAAIKTQDPRAWQIAAWSNFRLGKLDAASASFSQIVAQRPDDPDALGGLGYISLREGDVEAAERRFGGVLAKNPGDAAAMQGMAHVRQRQGRLDDARGLFQEVLRRNPKNEEVREILKKL